MKEPVSYYAVCVLLLSATSCSWSTPVDGGGRVVHATIQTAGYAGLVSAGLGFDSGRWSHDALVGFVPASTGGEDLWSLTARTSYGLHKMHHLNTEYRAYVGLSLHCSFDDDTFFLLPEKYRAGYYMPTALRAALSLRFEAIANRHAVYIEVSSLDIALAAKVRNWSTLGWEEAVTLGLGYRYRFPRRDPSPLE